MLNEPDDSQTMVRLLMYANKMDIEGLIAVSSCHQYLGKGDSNQVRNNVQPQEIHKFINAYAEVLENLERHETGWPSAEYLISKVGSGPPEFGMDGVGEGRSTTGSKLIESALLNDDPRPVYVCINAGASCLAQALFDMNRELDSVNFNKAISKLRVYDDAGQDNAGAWIASTFPQIHYQRSSNQVFSFMNDQGPATWDTTFYAGKAQHLWAKEHVQNDHGPLGRLYPTRMKYLYPDRYSHLEGGGTSTWIGHVNHGLFVPEEISWGGWGGCFIDKKQINVLADGQLKWAGLEGAEKPYLPFFMFPQAEETWTDPSTGKSYSGVGVPIYRWRQAYQNDFEARMDWCMKDFEEANHNPVAVCNGDKSDAVMLLEVETGQSIQLDASASSDPDGDKLSFRWYNYPGAETYSGNFELYNEKPQVTINIPSDASNSQIHVILEVRDESDVVNMYDYRRIILNVAE